MVATSPLVSISIVVHTVLPLLFPGRWKNEHQYVAMPADGIDQPVATRDVEAQPVVSRDRL
jgi:hypothetical protein